jgi:hypothetical protein
MASKTLLTLRANPVYKNFCLARDDTKSNTVLVTPDVTFILDTVDENDRSFFIKKSASTHGFYAYEDPQSITHQTRMNPTGLQRYLTSKQNIEAISDSGNVVYMNIVSVIHTKSLRSKVFYVTADIEFE